MPAPTKLTADATYRPAEAREEVIAAYAAEDGNTTRAAERLGVSRVVLRRVVRRLELEDLIRERWPAANR